MHIEVSTFSSHDAPTKVIFYKGAKQSIEITSVRVFLKNTVVTY